MFEDAFKLNIWRFGIVGFAFGISDRLYNLILDGYYSAIDLMQLFTATTFALMWLTLKPSFKNKNL